MTPLDSLPIIYAEHLLAVLLLCFGALTFLLVCRSRAAVSSSSGAADDVESSILSTSNEANQAKPKKKKKKVRFKLRESPRRKLPTSVPAHSKK
ncbi:hypothetical protein DRE_05190 [Drechslerella stenobrocha 248]|uniref:Uncharacterized protein n=1 Tax=Drechslerella stenobrocha 248 TaxID=1043628 RepID=W7I0A7_9PEZI|nr:hypothetical protein DRE_05189 [Drechslerella stenobrocha 248]EWC45629.1 hypothetical protein DRE_05190 [Drechslerella stenobrocha 248]